MFFQSRNSHTGPLFKVSKIFKFFDKTALENCIFISESLKGLLPSIFNNWFKFSFESHSHDTRWSNLGYLKMPSYRTKTYGRYSMFVNSIYVWNHSKSCHQNVTFHQLRASKLKEVLITFFLTSACVYKLSIFTQNKLALKPIQDFSLCFGPAIQEFSAVINRIFT